MNYSRVYIDSLGYELAPVVVTSQELEERLRPLYQSLRMPEGQLEALTGIVERRWWDAGFPVSQGAVAAARKALNNSNVPGTDIDIDRMLEARSMEVFKNSLATLTGGSGAVAVLLTDGSYSAEKRRRLLGGVTQAAPEFHGLCRWGFEVMASAAPPPVADLARRLVDEGSRLGRSAIRQVT